MPVAIKPLDAPFGAEVRGLEIAAGVSDADFAVVEEAFERYSVLVFPGQDVTDAQQIAFSERFGPLERTISANSGVGSAIAVISNVGADGAIIPLDGWRAKYNSGNEMWHTDSSFKRVPAKASLLSGRETPPEGADTEFASMRLAYADLDAADRAWLEGKVAIHDFAYSRGLVAPDLLNEKQRQETPPVPQALIRRNPKHGAPALYVGAHARCIVGEPEAASRERLMALTAFTARPGRVYRHKWRPKDIVMWDNRACLHRGTTWDKAAHRRVMHRTTVAGAGPSASLTADGGAVVHPGV